MTLGIPLLLLCMQFEAYSYICITACEKNAKFIPNILSLSSSSSYLPRSEVKAKGQEKRGKVHYTIYSRFLEGQFDSLGI